MSAPALLQPLALRELVVKNRVVVSPMCQYSAHQGVPNEWHLVHLGRFALGGAALVFTEATAVEPEGRISSGDTGLYDDVQQQAFAGIVRFLKSQGTLAGIQLAHAGRKASTLPPWEGGGPVPSGTAAGWEAWKPLAPSAIPFADGYPVPAELSLKEIERIKSAFVSAAGRALAAGFDVIELHTAHGYLLAQFLSPISNQRGDRYGGDLNGRMRLPLEIVEAVRGVWPDTRPLFVRISSVDGSVGGWSLEDSVVYARELAARGVDVIDCYAGGLTRSTATLPDPREPGYQVPFAQRIKRETGVRTMAVGRIVNPEFANSVIERGDADLVAIGRAMLDDPNWALHAREALAPETVGDSAYPRQVGYAMKALKGAPKPR